MRSPSPLHIQQKRKCLLLDKQVIEARRFLNICAFDPCEFLNYGALQQKILGSESFGFFASLQRIGANSCLSHRLPGQTKPSEDYHMPLHNSLCTFTTNESHFADAFCGFDRKSNFHFPVFQICSRRKETEESTCIEFETRR